MPTLDWIGKDKVVDHHLDVPYRVLEKRYSFGEPSGNMIIRGDNLDALKALLPMYEGRVKCIYIDPPYNTGNEGWVYNDRVNDPKIAKWLGAVVGKEGEDLTRHDKWLCMMYPRLKLLQKLLSDDGAIFISIDDNEQANLKLICDEIFGAGNFVANISWQRTYSTRNDSKGIVSEVEHILTYSKQQDWNPNRLPRSSEMNNIYKNPDNDVMPWTSSDAFGVGAATHQGMVYAIQSPFNGKMIYPTQSRHWTISQDQMFQEMNKWCEYELRDLGDAKERAAVCGVSESEVRQGVKAIVLSKPLDESAAQARAVYERGQWPKFYFTKGGQGGIRRKTYLDSVGGQPPTNLWEHKEVGHTDEAAKTLKAIFDGQATFDTPKPPRLIERILQIASDKDSIILDSFAGSGTTAHAVLNMNKADGGSRRFILVEMNDYAETITAERVRRVIDGYGEGKSAVPGTGGGFGFYVLGDKLMENGLLNEAADTEAIREYVWFMETRSPYEKPAAGNEYYLGSRSGTAYYFYYKKDELTELDYDFLISLPDDHTPCVIYADTCQVNDERLEELGVVFKKIPRDIARL